MRPLDPLIAALAAAIREIAARRSDERDARRRRLIVLDGAHRRRAG